MMLFPKPLILWLQHSIKGGSQPVAKKHDEEDHLHKQPLLDEERKDNISEIPVDKKELEKPKSLHEILSDAKRNYTETTGKPAGGSKKRRKTKRKRSKKSRVLQLRKKSYSKRKAK